MKYKKIPITFSVSLQTALGLEKIVKEEGIIKSHLVEDLLKQYISAWLLNNEQNKEEEF